MIYIVEDDENIRELVVYTAEQRFYSERLRSAFRILWQVAGDDVPDLILLDVMLPEEDGISILKKIRKGQGIVRCASDDAHGVRERIR